MRSILGADYYMLKPFDKQMLLNRIKHISALGDRTNYERTGMTDGERRNQCSLWKTESGNRCDQYYP